MARWGIGAALVVGAAAVSAAVAVVRPARQQAANADSVVTAARGMGQALARTLDAAPARTRPQRCALRPPSGPGQITVGKRAFHREGDALVADGHGVVILGVVADARGASPTTLANAAEIKEAFAHAGVQIVASLGGMGESKDEIETVLRAIADPRWLVVAIPGDREPVAAHAQAIAELRAAGLPVIDAASLRRITVGGLTLAPLPGVALDGYGLVAGPDGCGRGAEEIARVPEAAVLLSHAPPRQAGATATDLTREDLHVGDASVTAAAVRAHARLVVHGLLDETGGRIATEPDRIVAAAGALDGASPGGSALVIELDASGRPRVRVIGLKR